MEYIGIESKRRGGLRGLVYVVSLPTFCGCEVEPGAVCVLLHEDGGWVGVRELPGACVVLLLNGGL